MNYAEAKENKAVCADNSRTMDAKGGRLLFLSMAAAMGGFLFGYDTAVINGGEQQIQSVWGLSSFIHGLVMSSALWGTVIGAVCGGKVCDRIGRKPTLFWVGVLYLASAAWSAFAFGPWDLIVARFVGGLGVGASSIAAPVYIAEIAPPERRGQLGGLFQFNIVLGMVVSQFVNWGIGSAGLGDATWRWMLGSEMAPALAFTLLTPFLDESPRWLRSRETRDPTDGRARSPSAPFFSRANRRPILLAFAVAMFNQLSGINAMMYFAKRVFEMAGFTPQVALGTAAGMSVVLGLGTFAGLFLIDRLGRRTLLIIGSIGCIVAHFAAASAFVFDLGLVAAICIFQFIVFFAVRSSERRGRAGEASRTGRSARCSHLCSLRWLHRGRRPRYSRFSASVSASIFFGRYSFVRKQKERNWRSSKNEIRSNVWKQGVLPR